MYLEANIKLAVYAPNEFGKAQAKTAEGVMRYGVNPIACVIDAACAGSSVKALTGIESDAPIVSSIAEAKALGAGALLLGTAWSGGAMPSEWKKDIEQAILADMDIVNGLHDFLGDDAKLSQLAKERGKRLFDVRRSPEKLPVACGRVMKENAFVVLTVGTDCSVGKMTASLEIRKSAREAGLDCQFIATGQTGMMIEGGEGIAIDRVIGDFMAGATEMMIVEKAKKHPGSLILVEGQGSLSHPGFSGVTMALVHGSCPQAMILCHRPSRGIIKGSDKAEAGVNGAGMPISSYTRLIETYESMAAYMRPAKVVGIALNTHDLSEEQRAEALRLAQEETGLPVCDPVRESGKKLLTAIQSFRNSKL